MSLVESARFLRSALTEIVDLASSNSLRCHVCDEVLDIAVLALADAAEAEEEASPLQLTTARRSISAGMEQAGLLGQAISQVRAARKQERQNRKAGRVGHGHPHRRTQRERRPAQGLASARHWREVYGIDPYARLGDAGAITVCGC